MEVYGWFGGKGMAWPASIGGRDQCASVVVSKPLTVSSFKPKRKWMAGSFSIARIQESVRKISKSGWVAEMQGIGFASPPANPRLEC